MLISSRLKTAHRDGRPNSNGITDYVISSPAVYDSIQNFTLSNDLSFDHSTILFDISTNIDNSIPLPIKVKLYHKAD